MTTAGRAAATRASAREAQQQERREVRDALRLNRDLLARAQRDLHAAPRDISVGAANAPVEQQTANPTLARRTVARGKPPVGRAQRRAEMAAPVAAPRAAVATERLAPPRELAQEPVPRVAAAEPSGVPAAGNSAEDAAIAASEERPSEAGQLAVAAPTEGAVDSAPTSAALDAASATTGAGDADAMDSDREVGRAEPARGRARAAEAVEQARLDDRQDEPRAERSPDQVEVLATSTMGSPLEEDLAADREMLQADASQERGLAGHVRLIAALTAAMVLAIVAGVAVLAAMVGGGSLAASALPRPKDGTPPSSPARATNDARESGP